MILVCYLKFPEGLSPRFDFDTEEEREEFIQGCFGIPVIKKELVF